MNLKPYIKNYLSELIQEFLKLTQQGKKQWLGIILPPGGEELLSEIYETLSYYPGDTSVVIKKNGVNHRYTGGNVRKCNGLIAELKAMVGEQNIVFFET